MTEKQGMLLMIRRAQDGYIYSTAVILFVTAMVKFFSALGSAPILDWLDPLLLLTNRHVFVLTGIMEIGISAYLFLGNERRTKTVFIAWLAGIYLIYRLGLWWAGAANLCHCLGNLSDRFPISPLVFDHIAWALLGWLMVGSSSFLIVGWHWDRKTSSTKK